MSKRDSIRNIRRGVFIVHSQGFDSLPEIGTIQTSFLSLLTSGTGCRLTQPGEVGRRVYSPCNCVVFLRRSLCRYSPNSNLNLGRICLSDVNYYVKLCKPAVKTFKHTW